MEDILTLSALFPLTLSLVAVVLSYVKVKSRFVAEKHFVDALRAQIDQKVIEVPAKTSAHESSGKPVLLSDFNRLDDFEITEGHGSVTLVGKSGDDHFVYILPPSSTLNKDELSKKYKLLYGAILRYSLDDSNEFPLVKNALRELSDTDRKKIESTLENNTSTGRRRYLSTVFRDAIKHAH